MPSPPDACLRLEPPLVVVVDDEAALRDGYRAACFGSGEELMRFAARKRASCVVLDCRLQGIGGFELQEVVGKSVPVIFITAHEQSDGRLRATHITGGRGGLPAKTVARLGAARRGTPRFRRLNQGSIAPAHSASYAVAPWKLSN